MRKITVSIPYYNRAGMVMETIIPLLNMPEIDEIILCDDCSPFEDFSLLNKYCKNLPKVRIVKNVMNVHNSHNKRNCTSFAKNEWVLILDNDNIIDYSFIEKLYSFKNWNSNTIYHPAFASPNFDYRQFNNSIITKKNVPDFCGSNIFITLANTNNYFVNRDEYIRVYQFNPEVRGADGIYYFYCWLMAGNNVQIVPDLQYFHRVHEGSEFLREVNQNMSKVYEWLEKLKTINNRN